MTVFDVGIVNVNSDSDGLTDSLRITEGVFESELLSELLWVGQKVVEGLGTSVRVRVSLSDAVGLGPLDMDSDRDDTAVVDSDTDAVLIKGDSDAVLDAERESDSERVRKILESVFVRLPSLETVAD